jgi:hypothetical protein
LANNIPTCPIYLREGLISPRIAESQETEFHTKRIEMANRTLMSAARTLVKVKKSRLPDVLALVSVNPLNAGPT